jgi:hypothetical protein
MRFSDQDYGRDLRRFNLALRMLQHEARLSTVCAWTGFNEERVRILSRSRRRHQVVREAGTHRGPSPRRLRLFFESPRLRGEAAAIGGMCRLFGIIPGGRVSNPRLRLPGIANGERLCDAFELYREIVPAASLTLEQVISLVFALSEGVQCSLDHCTRCRALILVDHLSVARRVCAHCPEEERCDGAEELLQVAEPVPDPKGSAWQPLQRSLFEFDDHAGEHLSRESP